MYAPLGNAMYLELAGGSSTVTVALLISQQPFQESMLAACLLGTSFDVDTLRHNLESHVSVSSIITAVSI